MEPTKQQAWEEGRKRFGAPPPKPKAKKTKPKAAKKT